MTNKVIARRYCSYLLRMWEERRQDKGDSGVWRFSLEEVRTEKRYGFTDLPEVMAFLEIELMKSEEKREGNSPIGKGGSHD